MRIVADTNTAVSGLLWHGAPRQLIDAFREGKASLSSSPVLLAELAEVLARDKLAERIRRAKLSVRELVEDYAGIADVVEPVALPEAVSRDPDDDEVLACALAAHADFVVSGDGDLLTLETYRDIPILTAAQAMEKITTGFRGQS